MNFAAFYEQYPSGTSAPIGTPSAFNRRALNAANSGNNLAGCSLDYANNVVSIAPGTYKISALAKSSYYQTGQLCVFDYTNNTPLIVGTSEFTPTGTAFSQAGLTAEASDIITIAAPIDIGLAHYVGVVLGLGTAPCLGTAVQSGVGEKFAQLIIEAV